MLRNLQVVLSTLVCFSLFANSQVEPQVLESIEIRAKRHRPRSVEITEHLSQSVAIDVEKNESLKQVLQKNSSVWVETLSQEMAPRISLRGQSGSENRFFLEGVPLTDGQFNADFVGALPMASVGQVDIYPDGSPVGLNSDGLGGALDFQLWGRSRSSLSFKTGNLGFLEAYGRQSLGNEKRWLVLSASKSDENFSYYDDGGTAYNLSDDSFQQRDHNRFVKVGLVPNLPIYESSQFNLRYFGFNSFRQLEIPGSIAVPAFGDLRQIFHLSALKAHYQITPEVSATHLFFSRLNWERFQGMIQSLGNTQPEEIESSDQVFGLKTQLRYALGSPTVVEHNFSLLHESYDKKSSKNRGVERNVRWDIPASVGLKIPMETLAVKPAVLAQFTKVNGAQEQHYFLGSPRLGMTWETPFSIRDLSAESSVGRYFRVPSMIELFGNTNGLSPSEDLRPEHANKWVSSLMMVKGLNSNVFSKWVTRYSFSLAQSEDLIVLVENSQNSRKATNLGRSIIQTHDLNLEFEFLDKFFSQTAGVYTQGKNLSDVSFYSGKKIPNLPNFMMRQQLGYQNSDLGIRYQVQWLGDRYWDMANTKSLSPTSEHSLFLNWNLRKWGFWNLELINIFDTITATSVVSGFALVDNTTGYLGYPAAGRRIYLSWQYEI